MLRIGLPMEWLDEDVDYGLCQCGEPLSDHIFRSTFDPCFIEENDISDFISRWVDHLYPFFSSGVEELASQQPALHLIEFFLFEEGFDANPPSTPEKGESFPYWSWRIKQDPQSVSPAIFLHEDGLPLFSSSGKAETFSRWTYHRGMSKRSFPTEASYHTLQ